MRFTSALLAIALASWLLSARQAAAQSPDPRMAMTYTAPPVSPYLNLGYNQDGSSNYQSLVRPMLEEREGLLRQSATLQQLQKRVRDSQYAPDSAKGGSNGRPVRMYYSHYYDGLRSGIQRPADR